MLFDQILSIIPCAVFWKDKNGVFQGCNKRFLEFAGIPKEEQLINKTDKELPWSDRWEEYYQDDQYVILHGETITRIEKVTTPLKEITAHTTKTQWIQDGKVIGILGVILDITELNQAKENAEVANKAKMEFLYNMRHDLRTPFSGVYSLSEHLEAQEDNPEKKEILGYIKNSAKMLLDQVNEILEFINAEEGSLPILDKEFDAHKLLLDIENMFKPTAVVQKLDFSVTPNANLPTALIGDQVRTQRILINLISNATKFTKEGYIKVSAEAKKQKERTVIISFTVEDTGIGIPEDKQEVIFERFNRLTSSYSGTYSGKGLGLRLVKRFLDELGGEVQVKSTLGQGSTFTILIPYKLPLLG